MENKKVLNIAIGLVTFAALVVIVIAIFAGKPGVSTSPVAAQPTARPKLTASLPPTAAPAIAAPTSLLVATTTAATATPVFTLTPTVLPATSPAQAGFPTITNGPAYPAKFAEEGLFIQPFAGKPLVSRETALTPILSGSQGITFTIVSDHQIVENGQTILYTAYYGLVTVGYRGPNGLWAGSFLNIPLQDCTKGDCKPTGEVLDHIENRPMWLFDLEVDVPNGGVTCPPAGTPCPTPRDNNHQVDLVDAQTLMFIGGADYYQP